MGINMRRNMIARAAAGATVGLLAVAAGYAALERTPASPATPAPAACAGQGACAGNDVKACPKSDCPKKDAGACPAGGACPQAQPKAATTASAPAGYSPSAFPNVNVRFQPNAYRTGPAVDASIVVRPGADPRSVRRSARASAPAEQRVVRRPDGSVGLRGDPSQMNLVTARRTPSGQVAASCGVPEAAR